MSGLKAATELQGLRVLVTRPRPQAEKLAAFLRAHGAQAVVMPMLEICARPIHQLPLPLDIATYQKVIVISTSAAEHLFKHSLKHIHQSEWITPGRGTAEYLFGYGVQAICPTMHFTSEAILDLPALQHVAGQNILLVKGEGGRELLAQTLTQRRANVTSLTVYQRRNPDYGTGLVARTVEDQKINAIVATSGEIVANLALHTREAASVRALPLLVPSHRVSEIAKAAGFTQIHLTLGASNSDIASALKRFV